jgi:Ca-activated chloride channel family protein
MTRRRIFSATAAAFALAAAGVAPVVADESPATEQTKVVLVLDASGSMNEPDPSGVTKLEAAKTALIGALGSLPEDADVGLRVYGATVDGPGRTPAECADSQLVHPIEPLDEQGLTAAIRSFDAIGETPIAYSLQEAAKDLGADGKRHIILVSDGEERCVPDPCVAVQDIIDAGIGVQIDTVGFGVGDVARQQLTCIAEAGGGTYYDAADAGTLTTTLNTLSTRTARPFTIEGTPVEGSPTPEGAPLLDAGQYVDSVASSSQGMTTKYYRVPRTQPGSTIRVSMVGRMPAAPDGLNRGRWDWRLSTPDGLECSSRWALASDTQRQGVIAAGTVMAVQLDPRAQQPDARAQACAEADELVYEVKRGNAKTAVTTDVEIRVMEEAPAADAESLPDGVASVPRDNSDQLTSPASGAPVSVVGGTSFNDALAIEPGTYVTDLVPGEVVLFKTRVDWGQEAIFAIDGPDPAFAPLQGLHSLDWLNVPGNVYAPDFSQMDSQELLRAGMYRMVNGRLELTSRPDINQVPQVNFRNRWDSPRMYFSNSNGFSMAGDYYFAVGLGELRDGILRGVPVPIRFSIAVNGEVKGAPEYVEADAELSLSPTAGATPEPSDLSPATEIPAETGDDATDVPPAEADPAGSALPLVGGALLVVGAVGAGVYAAVRRR